VVRRELRLRTRQDPELWASCIAGALREEELGELARAASINFYARKPLAPAHS